MSVSEEMYQELEKDRKLRRLETVQEVGRVIISEYLRNCQVMADCLKDRANSHTPERKIQLLKEKK